MTDEDTALPSAAEMCGIYLSIPAVDEPCAQCGRAKSEHTPINVGPLAGPVYLCPRSVYQPET
jgi:hypothetical protein